MSGFLLDLKKFDVILDFFEVMGVGEGLLKFVGFGGIIKGFLY